MYAKCSAVVAGKSKGFPLTLSNGIVRHISWMSLVALTNKEKWQKIFNMFGRGFSENLMAIGVWEILFSILSPPLRCLCWGQNNAPSPEMSHTNSQNLWIWYVTWRRESRLQTRAGRVREWRPYAGFEGAGRKQKGDSRHTMCSKFQCCARYTEAAPYVKWPRLGKCWVLSSPQSPKWPVCPSGVWQNSYPRVRSDRTPLEPGMPRFLPGSAFPLETFRPTPAAAQSHEGDLNFPYFTPATSRQSTYRQGQCRGNPTTWGPALIKLPKQEPQIRHGLTEHVVRHERSSRNHWGGGSWRACRQGEYPQEAECLVLQPSTCSLCINCLIKWLIHFGYIGSKPLENTANEFIIF